VATAAGVAPESECPWASSIIVALSFALDAVSLPRSLCRTDPLNT
jgi:hypothetical protein